MMTRDELVGLARAREGNKPGAAEVDQDALSGFPAQLSQVRRDAEKNRRRLQDVAARVQRLR